MSCQASRSVESALLRRHVHTHFRLFRLPDRCRVQIDLTVAPQFLPHFLEQQFRRSDDSEASEAFSLSLERIARDTFQERLHMDASEACGLGSKIYGLDFDDFV